MGRKIQAHVGKPGMDQPAISNLDCREIQAPIAACLIKMMLAALKKFLEE